MKAYKGFNQDLTCRGFQYAEGETYTTDKAELCRTGFHACLEPMDVFSYYHPSSGAVVHEVEVDDNVEPEPGGSDSKVASRRITIGSQLDLMGMIKVHLGIVWDKVAKVRAATPDQASSGYQSTAASSGYQSTAAVSGPHSVAVAAGLEGKAKGAEGCVLLLIERASWQDKNRILAHKSVMVGRKCQGLIIKPDTWYQLVNGRVVEA